MRLAYLIMRYGWLAMQNIGYLAYLDRKSILFDLNVMQLCILDSFKPPLWHYLDEVNVMG